MPFWSARHSFNPRCACRRLVFGRRNCFIAAKAAINSSWRQMWNQLICALRWRRKQVARWQISPWRRLRTTRYFTWGLEYMYSDFAQHYATQAEQVVRWSLVDWLCFNQYEWQVSDIATIKRQNQLRLSHAHRRSTTTAARIVDHHTQRFSNNRGRLSPNSPLKFTPVESCFSKSLSSWYWDQKYVEFVP